jgi:hypothetical protein
LRAKVVQRRQRASWGDFEHRAAAAGAPGVIGPAAGGCPVEITVGGLSQPVDEKAVRTAEFVQGSHRSAGGDFEERAAAILVLTARNVSAEGGCPVEISVTGLDQGRWEGSVLEVEAVQRSERALWRDFEDCPARDLKAVVGTGSERISAAV